MLATESYDEQFAKVVRHLERLAEEMLAIESYDSQFSRIVRHLERLAEAMLACEASGQGLLPADLVERHRIVSGVAAALLRRASEDNSEEAKAFMSNMEALLASLLARAPAAMAAP